MTNRLRGVIAPVLTPFDDRLEPDVDRFIAHSRWLVEKHAGLAIFGTNSEAASLSMAERLSLTEALGDGGVPAAKLMPGTGACALPDAVKLTRHASRLGAAGVLVLPPFYFKGVSDDGLFAYYAEIIERVGSGCAPLYLYHIPQMSQVPITLGLIERLLKRYLSFAEREEIALLRVQGTGVREIARRLERSPSTVSRELTRNAATRGGKLEYRASLAQWKSELLARRPKPAKLVMNPRLRQYVQDRLEGKIHDAQGREVAGPRQAPFIGRNKPHRGDRKWVNGWSPEQIANRLQVDFPDDQSMRISHEAIYQALYIQGRGALKRNSPTSTIIAPGLAGRQHLSDGVRTRLMVCTTE